MTFEDRRRRIVADGDENTVDRKLGHFVRLDVAKFRTGHACRVFIADDVLHDVIPEDINFRICEEPILQDLLGAQLIAAVDQRHFVSVVGKIERFLDRGVAATDDRHFLLAEENPSQAGAGGKTEAHELLRRKAQASGPAPSSKHHRIPRVGVAGILCRPERPGGEVDFR